MGHEVSGFRYPFNYLIGEQIRFYRRYTVSFYTVYLLKRFNQIKEIFSKSTVEFYFVAERTDYIIKALLSIGFPIKEVELTNTSLLDTIFEGTHIEETQND